jgi:hypothetical protein
MIKNLFQDELNVKNKKCSKTEKLERENKNLKSKIEEYRYIEKLLVDNGEVSEDKYHIVNTVTDIKSKKSNLRCWFCTYNFDTIPLGLPESYDSKSKTYKTRGIFCSFNCCHAYNISLDDYKVFERLAFLNQIKREVFKGDKREDMKITPSLDKRVLLEYGGPMSIHEYRNKSIFIPTKKIDSVPLLIPLFEVIEEIPFYFKAKNSKRNVLVKKLKLNLQS